jgi:hypothetical protein
LIKIFGDFIFSLKKKYRELNAWKKFYMFCHL